jgi:peptidyl-prolyl cis-trans isomerase C
MSQSACQLKPAIPSKKIVVSVDGVVIAREAIAQEIQHHPAATAVEAWTAAARALVVRELLLQEARRLDLEPAPIDDGEGRRETDDEALVRALVEQEVQTPEADDATCRRFYDRNRQQFRSANLYEARHILFAAAPGSASARKEASEHAKSVIAELARDPAAFTALAETLSACPSGKTGGNLGQLGPGQTVPEFERALSAMAVGTVHPEPIETRYGFHVVALDRRIEGCDLPFDLVRLRIAEWLSEKVRRVAIQQYVSILAARAQIEGVQLAPAGQTPVQGFAS